MTCAVRYIGVLDVRGKSEGRGRGGWIGACCEYCISSDSVNAKTVRAALSNYKAKLTTKTIIF